jgi:hypothetical protein
MNSSKILRTFFVPKLYVRYSDHDFATLSEKVKVLPPLEGCGRGGIRTPDTVVRSYVL